MESSFQQYLGSNYTPTVEETRQIQYLLVTSSREIQKLEAKIDELQDQLNMLEEQRLKMDDFHEQHLALLSPARKLTRDIVQEIFVACLPEDRNPCMSNMDAPILLTQICSTWRKIALSTPRLWAAIHIALPNIRLDLNSGNDFLQIQEKLVHSILNMRESAVKDWLDRSGACPLSISIYQSSGWGSNSELSAQVIRNMHMSLIQNALVPHQKRWNELDMYISDDTLERFHEIGLLEDSLKAIRKVHITCQTIHPVQPLRYQWRNAMSLLASHPSSVTLRNILIFPSDLRSSPAQFLGWEKLTELSLDFSQYSSDLVDIIDVVTNVLRQCKKLKTLKLDVLNARPVGDMVAQSYTEDVILSDLETLSIALPGASNAKAVQLSKRLYLPALKTLNFGFNFSPDFGMGEEIITSLLRVSESCSSLGLYWPYWLRTSDNMVELLQGLPYLECLYMFPGSMETNHWVTSISPIHTHFQDVINDDLLSALTPLGKDYPDIICPKLEKFECYHNMLTGFTEHGLKKFVKDRREDQRVATLRKVSVFVNRFKEANTVLDDEPKVSLGKDSVIYFRARDKQWDSEFLSPWLGIGDQKANEEFLPFEANNEI